MTRSWATHGVPRKRQLHIWYLCHSLANQTSPMRQQAIFWTNTSGLVAKDRGENSGALPEALGLAAGLIQ